MQLNRTELRVATDAAARAAGRAFSEFQNQEDDTVQIAIDYAVSTAAMNSVGANYLQLDGLENTSEDPDALDEITFGLSTRLDNGFGRYSFSPQDRSAVRNKTEQSTAIRIIGRRTTDSLGGSIQMLFAGWGPFSEFQPIVAATATQIDRDIALVLDRSGSMLEYKDWETLETAILNLYYQNQISYSEWYYGGRENTWIGERTYPYRTWQSWPVYEYQYNKYWNLYDDGFFDEYEYARDMTDRAPPSNGRVRQYNSNDPAPRHSRWAQLDDAVNAFLDVLDGTDQEERVSMTTFNSDSYKDLPLAADFDPIRIKVATVSPKNGTNISAGMQAGLETIINIASNPDARPYAAKTIVVLTDGIHTSGSTRPPTMAASLVQQYNVIIHAVTFSTSVPQSSKDEMAQVALIGGGRYYHADTGEELVQVFEQIANNLPTIITE